MKLDFRETAPRSGGAYGIEIHRDGKPLPYSEALEGWRRSEAFRAFFLSILESAPFAAFRWETPPLTEANRDRAFEFILLDSPEIDRAPDPVPFAEHFAAASPGDPVVVFSNLGGDSTLIVPTPLAAESTYPHLAAFTREAPREQNHALWAAVGEEMLGRLSESPIWLSTAGGGVAWLHVRLDSRPKYYGHTPYRTAP